MAADRKNYVMSVEFAMQREMAYREKLKARRASSTSNHALPSQVATASSQVPGTALVPLLPPDSALHPTVRTVPNPTEGLNIRPRPVQSPAQRPNSLHYGPTTGLTPCSTVRPISNPTPTPYLGPRPMQSPPLQRPNLQYNGQITGPTPVVRSPLPHVPRPRPGATRNFAHQKRKIPLHQPPQAEDYRCHLCDVDCTSELNLIMHLRGQKHKAKLRRTGSMDVSSGAMSLQQQGAKQQKHCGLCNVWCSDEKAYRLHLDGKNHILKCHAAEKRMKSCQ